MTDATFSPTNWDTSSAPSLLDSEPDKDDKPTPEPAPKKRTPATRAAAKRPAARKPARSKGVDRKIVTSVVEKTIAVQGVSDDDRDLLASILGVENDTPEIVVAILSGGDKTEGVSDAVELSEIDDDAERGVAAALLGAKLKPVWAVYHSLGLVAADAPESLSKSAIALSKAAAEFATDDIARARLDAVIEITQ